jgi:hypothetical protein
VPSRGWGCGSPLIPVTTPATETCCWGCDERGRVLLVIYCILRRSEFRIRDRGSGSDWTGRIFPYAPIVKELANQPAKRMGLFSVLIQ